MSDDIAFIASECRHRGSMLWNFLTLAVLAALMSTFAVVRRTRAGEESGRFELAPPSRRGDQVAAL
jgi:putative exporter of polyketide antibiotics